MNRAILASLADGAIAVTPNRRLARALLRAFDAEQLASGRAAWPTPSILPYQTWLTTLWEQFVAAGVTDDETLLLTPPQAALLWEQIVDADGRTLLDPRGAAALAAEAWSLIHAWGAGGESWRALASRRSRTRRSVDVCRLGRALRRRNCIASGMLDAHGCPTRWPRLAPRVRVARIAPLFWPALSSSRRSRSAWSPPWRAGAKPLPDRYAGSRSRQEYDARARCRRARSSSPR